MDGATPAEWHRLFVGAEGRVRDGWWVAIFFVVLAALLVPALVVADGLGVELSIIQQAGLIAAASCVCQLLRRRPMTEVTGRLDVGWLKELVIGGLVGSALMLVPALALLAGGWVEWERASTDAGALVSSLGLFAAVALAEELLFRGLPFQRLVAGLGQWPAQLLVAGFFLLTHLSNPGMAGGARFLAGANIALASVLLGLAFIRTGRLAMPLGMHWATNWMQGGLLGFGVSGESQRGALLPVFGSAPDWLTGGAFGLEASVPGLAVVAMVLLAVSWWRPSMRGSSQVLRERPDRGRRRCGGWSGGV